MPVVGLGLFAVLPLPIALPAYLVISAMSLFVYWSTYQAMHRPVTTGAEGMIGARAKAVTDLSATQAGLSPRGRIRYAGELWLAEADEPIPAGSCVTIMSVDGIQVRVRAAAS